MILLQSYQKRLESALDERIPSVLTHPKNLHFAMRDSILGGGKRLRGSLVYATGTRLGVEIESLDGPACAVEMIHAYSLVHDDLPAMDNADLRRGKPSCHKKYGEAMAILVGDALQALAFHALIHNSKLLSLPQNVIKMVEYLSQACGSRGMVGGQVIDLEATGRSLTLAELEDMHIHKTGALIRTSVLLGALACPEVDPAIFHALDHYGKCIGLAFQIQDDILDIEGQSKALGKPQGADANHGKPTYPSILGMEASKQHLNLLLEEAIEQLRLLPPTQNDMLAFIAQYMVDRQY